MADPRAQELTRQHRSNLAVLVALVRRQVGAVAVRADTSAIVDWWDAGAGTQVERSVASGHRAAVVLSQRYLRAHAALSGASVNPLPARFDVEAVRGALYVASVASFMRALRVHGSEPAAARVMVSSLTASAQRLVLAGDRDTVTGTFQAGR